MNRLAMLFLVLVAGCTSGGAAPSTQPADALRADVEWLASDEREGRLPGTAGADQAADYIEDRFKALGLQPADKIGGYKQSFTVAGKATIGKETFLRVAEEPLKLDTDYRPLAFSAEGAFDGKTAFVGYAVVSKEFGYDDFAGVDVKGRAVLAMRYEPHDASGKSRFTKDGSFSSAAAITAKAQAAHERGATAMLLVNPPTHHAIDAPLRPFMGDGGRMLESPIPILSITPQIAQKLLGERSLKDLQQQIDETGKPHSFTLDLPTAGKVQIPTQKVRTANVVGVLPGIGATKDEYVVVGAHYDHIGRGRYGTARPDSQEIHNGADDNASGTAAMLAVAQKLSHHRLERSMIFVAFSAEESGLHGSRHFVNNPPVPVEKMVAMINLDMVGRAKDNLLAVGGSGTRPAFRKLLAEADEKSPLKLRSTDLGGLGPSDHTSFALKKVPVLFFFTGLHPQYHSPDDDAWRINYDALAHVVDLTAGLIVELASLPREEYVSAFDGKAHEMGATTQPVTGVSRAWLGVVPDYGSDQSKGGVRIAGATPGSPAELAGLKEGDILVKMGARDINNLYDLSAILKKASPGDELDVYYLRAEKREMTRVKLTQRKGSN